MNMRTDGSSVQFSIAAVERDTGLGKDTLRVWERRYGFPQPSRDDFGERSYPLDQLEKLRIIKRLIDQGLRPGRIVKLDLKALHALSNQQTIPPQTLQAPESHEELIRFMDLIRQHQLEELRNGLRQALVQKGLRPFIQEVVAPLTLQVGEAWMRGQLAVFAEHLYTECITGLLRGVIHDLADNSGGESPTVLMTTFPQEAHGLGLLMAECIFALHGARCVSLGTQTPLPDIAQAVTAHQANIVALSFSSSMNGKQVIEGLVKLRQLMLPDVEIWVGGSNPVLKRNEQHQALVLQDFDQIGHELARWRLQH